MITYREYLFESLINEAREDVIASGNQGELIFDAYKQKDAKRFGTKFTNPLDLIRFMSKNTIPTYIQWVANQYKSQPRFFLEDLSTYKELLTQFDRLKKAAGDTVKKDLNQYKDIQTLRADIEKFSKDDIAGNVLMKKLYKAMQEQVKSGNGGWFHQSPTISVYQPYTWDGSKAMREAVGENNISLCVTYTNTDSYYDQYTEQGDLFFVLTPSMMYSFFFNVPDDWHPRPHEDDDDYQELPNEFSDMKNDHKKGAQFIKDNVKVLSDIFADYAEFFSGEWITPDNALNAYKNNPRKLVTYALHVLDRRWPEAEPYILKNIDAIFMYLDVIGTGRRWPEAEPIIMKDPRHSYFYAKDTVQGRWPAGEPAIMTNPSVAVWYAKDVIKNRWPKAEPIIYNSVYKPNYVLGLRAMGIEVPDEYTPEK